MRTFFAASLLPTVAAFLGPDAILETQQLGSVDGVEYVKIVQGVADDKITFVKIFPGALPSDIDWTPYTQLASFASDHHGYVDPVRAALSQANILAASSRIGQQRELAMVSKHDLEASLLAYDFLPISGRRALNEQLGTCGNINLVTLLGYETPTIVSKTLNGLRQHSAAYMYNKEVAFFDVSRTSPYFVPMVARNDAANEIVMPFIRGGSLKQVGPMTGDSTGTIYLNLLKHLAQMLVPLHAAGVSHNDLKMDNVFVNVASQQELVAALRSGSSDVLLKLGDFGLAEKRSTPISERKFQGTNLSVAPEVFCGGELVINSNSDAVAEVNESFFYAPDIWGLGPLFIEAVAGFEHAYRVFEDIVKPSRDDETKLSSKQALNKFHAIISQALAPVEDRAERDFLAIVLKKVMSMDMRRRPRATQIVAAIGAFQENRKDVAKVVTKYANAKTFFTRRQTPRTQMKVVKAFPMLKP